MDENVLNFVKQYIGDAIANYPKIPASKLNEVVEDASIRMVEQTNRDYIISLKLLTKNFD